MGRKHWSSLATNALALGHALKGFGFAVEQLERFTKVVKKLAVKKVRLLDVSDSEEEEASSPSQAIYKAAHGLFSQKYHKGIRVAKIQEVQEDLQLGPPDFLAAPVMAVDPVRQKVRARHWQCAGQVESTVSEKRG
ncbi:hypothetical protein HK097_006912 [Rhizophlyctis rosea]|uniref:Uncharacterized protein n=1 Tax=Rhizophlyctis rosea TaxID=64517 RepID=A0AAD5X2M2_9FUNG|nr:hypothetical protein HK097_006912 [Rhizophlyctis rosea]